MTTARLWVTLSEGVRIQFRKICMITSVMFHQLKKDMDHVRGNADIEEI